MTVYWEEYDGAFYFCDTPGVFKLSYGKYRCTGANAYKTYTLALFTANGWQVVREVERNEVNEAEALVDLKKFARFFCELGR